MIIYRLLTCVRKGEQPPWIIPGADRPLLPVLPRRTDHPGGKRLDNRKVLSGILFVLYTGIVWGPVALVPPPARPLGDSRRHPRSLHVCVHGSGVWVVSARS